LNIDGSRAAASTSTLAIAVAAAALLAAAGICLSGSGSASGKTDGVPASIPTLAARLGTVAIAAIDPDFSNPTFKPQVPPA
jgi:hypothetical protein